MEWEKAPASSAVNYNGREETEGMGEGVLYVKVMTDEQMEVLRRQISVYATLCEQLVELHRNVTAHQDSIAGMRLGNLYCDPLMTPGGPKITARQRWTPTPVQLQILESIFDQGNGTPSKQKIKEITLELAQHGQISETNVYNWFQNRRARSKRKQTSALPYNNTESEAEAENESPDEKKSKSDKKNCNDKFEVQNMNSVEPKRTQGMLPSNDCSKSSGSLGQMSYYESVLSHQRIDHLISKMEFPGDFHPFKAGQNYDMVE